MACLDSKSPGTEEMVNQTNPDLWQREFLYDEDIELFLTLNSSYKISTNMNSFTLGRKSFIKGLTFI